MRDESFVINHAFEDKSEYFGSVSPPIIQTSLFVFEKFEDLIEAGKSEEDNYFYTRGNNPTLKILEQKLAELENAQKAKVFGSGMGAISSVLISLLNANDHVLILNHVYGTSYALLDFLNKFGITYTQVYTNNVDDLDQYFQSNTKLVYFESPSSIMMDVIDIKSVCNVSKLHNCITLFDNSVNTPLVTKPIDFGVDIVVHSMSKYINGHSDVVAGCVCTSKELYSKIFEFGHQFFGSVLGPQEAYLVLRGLRTLPSRLKLQQDSTVKILDYLKSNENVVNINHPLVYENELRSICEKQMNNFTSLISFELNTTDFEKIKMFVNALSVFQIGVSWGGYESLILPLYRGENAQNLAESNFPTSIIRMYIGLENPEVLINDLEIGFSKL